MRFLSAVALAMSAWPARVAFAAAQGTNAASLRIVVIEGEDAVNVVQQKTAVAPVIEVRDRNDQPVVGAAVRFAIRNGHATFNGARNLSVITNAAGRAAASGLVPTGNGALQISATAAFQGQTAAITIAQTNVMTLAEAGAASAAASGGGAGAGAGTGGAAGGGASGGGISATTAGIVGGAAAGTAIAVKEVTGGGTPAATQTYTGQFAGTLLMTFSGQCTRNENQTGTLTMDLSENNGSISGKASLDGKITFDPGPCTVSTSDGFGFPEAAVSGTTTTITFTANPSNHFPGSSTGPGGTNAYAITFSGSKNGAQIDGTLTVSRSITSDSSSVPSGAGSVVYRITLR